MAARSPTGYTKYIDTSRMVPRGEVRSAGPSSTLNDQVFIRSKNEMMLSDVFYPQSNSVVAPTWTEIRRLFFAFDRCDGASTCNAEVSFFGWQWDLGGGPFDVSFAIYHVGLAARTSYTVSASHANKIWRPWTACTIYCDGTENEILLESQATNVSGLACLAGIALFTNY